MRTDSWSSSGRWRRKPLLSPIKEERMYCVPDLQACEAEEILGKHPGDVKVVKILDADDTSAHCPHVSVTAPTREALLDFVHEHWGDDENTGGWFSEYVLPSIERKCPDCVRWLHPLTSDLDRSVAFGLPTPSAAR